jgi:hypothetical protein
MSDTPKTDTETWRDEMDHVDTDYTFAQSVTVSADFARQLERELADMTKQRDHYKAACDQYSEDEMLCKLQEVTKQRDALADALESLCTAIISGHPREITGLLKQSRLALATTKGGQYE